MTQSNPLQITEKSPSDIQFQRKFWGVIAISVMALLAYSYVLSNLFSLEPTTAVYIKMAVYAIAIVLSVTSFILAIRRQVDLALTIIFYYLLIALVAGPATTQGRTLNSTFTMLVVGTLMIGWLLPRSAWRRNAAYLAVAFVLAWVFEWVNPPWRIVTGAAVVGPAVAIIFSVILIVLVVRESWGIVSTSLRLKITVWTGTVLVVLSAILITYSALSARQTAIQTAEDDALQHATEEAGIVRSQTEYPLNIARALAQTMVTVKDPASGVSISRDQANAILREVLVENPSFLGTYTLWEPNAFDGQDREYRGTTNHDKTGRFIPYWVRSDDGSIVVFPLEQYETPGIGDWYILPRQNMREMTFAPLIYPIGGVDTVMASFIAPVIYENKFYGITGVDAPIAFVQEIVDSVNLYNGNAQATLLTSSGTLIGVRNQPDLVNQPATEIYPDFSDLQPRIEAGEAFISLSADGQYLRAFAPIELGKTEELWSFGLIIPFAEITAPATVAALQQAAVSTGLILLAILILWYFTGQVVRPIRELTNTADVIAQGNLAAVASVQTEDETGILASAFNTMTAQLRGTLASLEERVAERTRNLELAAEVGRAVSQVRELDVMLKDACDLILREFDLYYVQVYLADPSQTNLILEAGTGEVGAQLVGRGHRLELNTGSINGRAAVEKRSVVISDTAQSATFRQNPLLPETRGEMAVPLIVGDKVVGVLDMQSGQPDVLTEEILPAFEALAGQLAVAVQNAGLLAETEQARAQVEAQARRLVREGWREHLDAIHKPEQFSYVFDRKDVTPLAEVDETQLPEDRKAITVPIAVTGESLGSLVVELDDETRAEQSSELVNIVARQVAQQIENLRLLESAERYRYEAEQAARLQTLEGWQKYIESRSVESLGYYYDLKEVHPQKGNGSQPDEKPTMTLPLKVRDEIIGKLAVQGIGADDDEALELANVVAERLGEHIESLRQFEETRRGQVELDKRARQLAAVAEVSTVSSRELDIQKLLESVVFLTQRRFGLYHAHVFIYNEDTEALKIRACGWKEGDEHEGTHGTAEIPLAQEQSLVARAARTRQPVIVNDVHNEPGWLPNPLLPDTLAEVAVPLVIGEQVLGVLDVQADHLDAFTEEDANIFSTLASQVATALQNAHSFTKAQKQAERESMLNVINQKIQSATSVEAVLQIAARELGHALGAPMTIAQLSMKDKSS